MICHDDAPVSYEDDEDSDKAVREVVKVGPWGYANLFRVCDHFSKLIVFNLVTEEFHAEQNENRLADQQ